MEHRTLPSLWMILVLVLLLPAVPAGAQLSSAEENAASDSSDKHHLTLCPPQDYAFCDASTCTATGGTIQGPGGAGTFPEAACLCPILFGRAFADLHGGNMQGSCQPPPNGLWSMFPPDERIDVPQEATDWQAAPAPTQDCPSKINGAPVYFAGCFSYACDDIGTINGARVARCFCRMLTTDEADFATAAGRCDPATCSQIPEGLTRDRAIRHGDKCEK